MKFTDGYWHVRPEFQVLRASRVESVETTETGVTLHATTRRHEGRGDTLNHPQISATYTAVADGVVRVEITHHAGRRPRTPAFALTPQGVEPSDCAVTVDDSHATLTSGNLTVTASLGDAWDVRFAQGGVPMTRSSVRSVGHVMDTGARRRTGTGGGAAYVHEQLVLDPGESLYGLGERFGPWVKNGQSVDIWNEDGGTASEQAYKNVPFYLSSRGYGVFVDHPGRVSFEIASEVASRCQFSVPGESLIYYVIAGPTPKEVLTRFTALTGRPPAVPDWSFGLWLSTSFTTDYDEATVTSFVEGMAARDIPLSVFHFDCFWMRQFHWCDFVWDPATFPDPEGMLRRLKARGLKICVWINPYIAQRSGLFREGAEQGFLVRRPDGDVWQTDLWQAGMGLVDFTNPDARRWYAAKLGALVDMGVDCFKTDFGERIPTDVVWHDGSDPERMHNYYTHLYNETVHDLLVERFGEGEAVLFARSATAGGQQFPVHWGGDCESTFEAMAETLRGGLSLASSGFGYWSHDIGGFEGDPDPAVFKRWVAFGLLSSHSRLHGSGSYRVPWAFDEEAVDVLRRFTRLKERLLPYLRTTMAQVTGAGTPMMRPMVLEFPGDPTCAYLDRQYMLGDSLLVAPVFSASGEVTYYVPDGTWLRLTGEGAAEVTGPRWVTEQHSFHSLPVLLRPGASGIDIEEIRHGLD